MMADHLSSLAALLVEKSSPTTRVATACCVLIMAQGCATAPSEIRVPVPVPCVPADFPQAPTVRSDADLRAMDDYRLVLALAEERARLAAWTAQAGPVVEACRR